MKSVRFALFLTCGALLATAPAFTQSEANSGQGRAVVTVLAKHNEVAPAIAQTDVSAKVNGKEAEITSWAPFKSPNDNLELVILIDSGARNLGRQMDEITHFILNLEPHTKVAVGYMQNGYSAMEGPLSTDHAQVAKLVHLPAGPLTNPYFALSDLAHKWPSQDPSARREVVMFTDGIDPENRRFDPDDPYVQAAIRDSVRAGVVVYNIYWRSFPTNPNSMTAEGGQSLLEEITQATGGNSYWLGSGNPVTFQPYFEDLMRRFDSQYALDFAAKLDRKPSVDTFKLKLEGMNLQVTAPQQVFVHPGLRP
jgi:hypothetical protein